MLDLNAVFAVAASEPDDRDDAPSPTTRLTASVETIDNDFASHLLGSLTIWLGISLRADWAGGRTPAR